MAKGRSCSLGRPRLLPLLAAGCLLLLLSVHSIGLQSLAGGIDFDLNAPPPPTQDDDHYDRAQELSQEEPDERVVGDEGPNVHQQQQQQQQSATNSLGGWLTGKARQLANQLSLPQYFDFQAYRSKFQKRYRASEAYLRQSVFVRKCLDIFKRRVAYRRGASSYTTGVNQFTDMTGAEFRSMFMLAPPIETYEANATSGQQLEAYAQAIRTKQLELQEAASEQVNELESASRCAAGGGASCAAAEDEDAELARVHQEIDRLLAGGPELAGAVWDELNERGVEQVSQAAPMGADGQQPQLPWPGQLKSNQVDNEKQQQEEAEEFPAGQLDWSQHPCFHEVYDQGPSCGKCYVMATTALAEFYKCSEAGPQRPIRQRKFSKDYVLDCAPKYAPTVFGCAGGSLKDTLRFIAHAGVYNIRDWRLKRQEALEQAKRAGLFLERSDLRCPLGLAAGGPPPPVEQWGRIRTELNPKLSRPAEWAAALRDGPLVVSVQMPAEGVDSYESGVHDGRGCATSGFWHAMLLVGHGRDELGRAYWRFRNSWGPNWGLAGHFHLSAEVPGECFGGSVRVFREPLEL